MGKASSAAGRFRALLAAKGLTQETAALVLGISRPYLTQVLSGRRWPSLEWLYDAAVALDLDPHELDERLAPRKPRAK